MGGHPIRQCTALALGAGLALLASVAAPVRARAQTISSAANQLFHVNDPSTPISPITVTDPAGNTIKFNRDIYITIPTGFNMTWDTSIGLATLTGSAAGRCNPNVTYTNGNHTVHIVVNTTFAPGDLVVISGLNFTSFTATSPVNNLFLSLKNNLSVDATDPKTIQVGPDFEVSVTPPTSSVTLLPSNGGSSTVNFTLTNTGQASDSYDLLTKKVPGTALTTVSIAGAGITQGANPDSAQRSALAVNGTVTVTVTYRVGSVALGTIDTLELTGRSVGNPAKTSVGMLVVTVIRPSITVGKSVNPSGNSPPGTDLTFTSTVTNVGTASASNLALVDSIPSWVQFKVGTASNTLPAGVTAATEYSNDGGVTWTYTPVSGGCAAPAGFDRCVNRIRWRLLAALASSAGSNQGTVSFVSRIR
jgi:uncharacterized repeat protein (TIGR01451 family)